MILLETSFDDIYSLFLATIDDYDMASIDDDELEYVLSSYLLNSLGHLQNGITNISEIDIDKKVFNVDLSYVERLAIAKAMKLEWVSTKKHSQELMAKAIGDRDYKAIQGTEYLKELTRVEKELRKEIDRILIDYSYSNEDFYGGLKG